MDIRAAEISAILKEQIKNFGEAAEVTEVGQVLSVGDRRPGRERVRPVAAFMRHRFDGNRPPDFATRRRACLRTGRDDRRTRAQHRLR